jgi:resuscitation-promoting factor RpfB
VAVLLAGALLLGSMSSDGAPDFEVDVPAVETPAPEPAYGVWDRLAQCESSGRWWLNTGNGYFGGLQMDMTFWRRHGGLQYAARPDLASRAVQIAVAVVGQSIQGFGAWPVCSRAIGVR